jgi:glycosyltransferase involved in cell wall biosynthesis
VPVAGSNRGALPEVIGDAGLIIDPADPEAMADAIVRLVSDESLRTAFISRGLARSREFTWENTANTTINLLLSVADLSGN